MIVVVTITVLFSFVVVCRRSTKNEVCILSNNPGKSNIWSPCRWVIKILFILCNVLFPPRKVAIAVERLPPHQINNSYQISLPTFLTMINAYREKGVSVFCPPNLLLPPSPRQMVMTVFVPDDRSSYNRTMMIKIIVQEILVVLTSRPGVVLPPNGFFIYHHPLSRITNNPSSVVISEAPSVHFRMFLRWIVIII